MAPPWWNGMVLKPLFKLLGYFTQLEVDLSLKQQLLDILVIRREKIPPSDSGLPKIYWEAFDNLNEHNLISFKSFRESFNGEALEEFFGHLTNYRKVNGSARTLTGDCIDRFLKWASI